MALAGIPWASVSGGAISELRGYLTISSSGVAVLVGAATPDNTGLVAN